jgi:hypothetical protein
MFEAQSHRETQCRQGVHKLINSIHSESYRSSGMLIHRQNSYAPRGKRLPGRREKQKRGTGQQS